MRMSSILAPRIKRRIKPTIHILHHDPHPVRVRIQPFLAPQVLENAPERGLRVVVPRDLAKLEHEVQLAP